MTPELFNKTIRFVKQLASYKNLNEHDDPDSIFGQAKYLAEKFGDVPIQMPNTDLRTEFIKKLNAFEKAAFEYHDKENQLSVVTDSYKNYKAAMVDLLNFVASVF